MCDETNSVFFEVSVYCHEMAKKHRLELIIKPNNVFYPSYNVKREGSTERSPWLIQTNSLERLESFFVGFSAAKEEIEEQE